MLRGEPAMCCSRSHGGSSRGSRLGLGGERLEDQLCATAHRLPPAHAADSMPRIATSGMKPTVDRTLGAASRQSIAMLLWQVCAGWGTVPRVLNAPPPSRLPPEADNARHAASQRSRSFPLRLRAVRWSRHRREPSTLYKRADKACAALQKCICTQMASKAYVRATMRAFHARRTPTHIALHAPARTKKEVRFGRARSCAGRHVSANSDPQTRSTRTLPTDSACLLRRVRQDSGVRRHSS
jgi:hypothetical protein